MLFRQELALQLNKPEWLVDVVSMSLGYYHELPSDVAFDQLLLEPLQALGELGVAVVAAAGNDATPRHMYPAGVRAEPRGTGVRRAGRRDPGVQRRRAEPERRDIALFSNAGAVGALSPARGGRGQHHAHHFQRLAATDGRSIGAGDGIRATIDMDDYRCGFATWSGTSFAAPVLAGELAQ